MNKTRIGREDAIAALREYRQAMWLIQRLEKQAIERMAEATSIQDLRLRDAELDEYKQAREHLHESLRLNPFFPAVHLQLANAYREIDDDANLQLQFYNSCLELDPSDDDVLVARMGLHLEARRLDEAAADLDRLRQLESDHVEPMTAHLAQLRNTS